MNEYPLLPLYNFQNRINNHITIDDKISKTDFNIKK